MSASPTECSRRRMLRLAGTTGLAAAALGFSAPKSVASPGPKPVSRAALCRDAWGARPPRGEGIPHVPNRMTIHHTEVVLSDNSIAPARLRQHQRYHQDSQGWIDIAYHYGVDRNGNIYELRDPGLVGDTATSYDPTGHFLVVCEGDFDQEDVTAEQLDGAAFVFAWAAEQYGITTDTLAGHRDFASNTTCPGSSLYAHVTSGNLKQRVDALLASGTVNLTTACGPAASAVVDEIASGLR